VSDSVIDGHEFRWYTFLLGLVLCTTPRGGRGRGERVAVAAPPRPYPAPAPAAAHVRGHAKGMTTPHIQGQIDTIIPGIFYFIIKI